MVVDQANLLRRLRRQPPIVKALQESLLVISNRVETIKDEHDKLYNNNKVLQRFIEDLTGSTKMTDSATRANPS